MNIYRIDYDEGFVTHWAWCDRTGTAFHNYWEFGWFRFEAETTPVPPDAVTLHWVGFRVQGYRRFGRC